MPYLSDDEINLLLFVPLRVKKPSKRICETFKKLHIIDIFDLRVLFK